MPIDPKKQPVQAATQDHLDVEEIVEGIIITKDGTFVLVIQTTSVNFDLLSETEQEVKIQAFASLINSLDFQMQILVETQRININNYIKFLEEFENKNLTPGLQRQFTIYKKFVSNLIVKNEILDKKFFIIIPFRSATYIGPNTKFETKKKLLQQAANYLYPKKNHILKLLQNMGLKGQQLTTKELTTYFYKTYNPDRPIKIANLNLEENG